MLYSINNALLASHTRCTKTYEKLRQRFFWVGMWKDVKHWTKTCLACRKAKQRVPHSAGYITSLYNEPFDTLGTDLVGPFPRTKKRNIVALTCVDCFTHWPIFIALPNMKAETVARAFLDSVICEHGCPRKLLSDRGTQFLAELVRQVCQILEVKQLYSSGYHPQTNAQRVRDNSSFYQFFLEDLCPQSPRRLGFVPTICGFCVLYQCILARHHFS